MPEQKLHYTITILLQKNCLKNFFNNHLNIFKKSEDEYDMYHFSLYKDCFTKQTLYKDESEYRILISLTENNDPENPIEKPFYFYDKRKLETAFLIEFDIE